MTPIKKSKPTYIVNVIGFMDDLEFRVDTNLQSVLQSAKYILMSKTNHLRLKPLVNLTNKQVHYFGHDYFKSLEEFAKLPSNKVIIATGDPGYFGALRSIRYYFSDHKIISYPAKTSVSLAFSVLGETWDDATVISTLGRPIFSVLNAIAQSLKTAILCSKQLPPNKLGKLLIEHVEVNWLHSRDFYTVYNLHSDPIVSKHSIESLIDVTVNYDSILLILPKNSNKLLDSLPHHSLGPSLIASNLKVISPVFGEPVEDFLAVGSMITKPEVRAVILSKLAPQNYCTLLEVGAGSGSISIEAIKLAPLMRVISFEKDPTAYENLKGNMKSHNVVFETHLSDFYKYKRTLPKADRILIGGGKLDQFDRLLNVANPNATIVGTFASLDRAQKLAKILGNLVQININTGKTFTDGTMHLVANNPVFIVWGQFNSI